MNNSGDSDDGVKHLTTENWLDPDPTGAAFGEYNPTTGEQRAASGEGWAKQFLDVELIASAPAEVRDMWEVARGVLLYGWFYYPLYALGEHQLRRVADVAILYRYQQAGGPPNKKPNPEDGQPTWPSFKRRVDSVVIRNVVTAFDYDEASAAVIEWVGKSGQEAELENVPGVYLSALIEAVTGVEHFWNEHERAWWLPGDGPYVPYRKYPPPVNEAVGFVLMPTELRQATFRQFLVSPTQESELPSMRSPGL